MEGLNKNIFFIAQGNIFHSQTNDCAFELDRPPPNGQGVVPNLQLIVCEDARQVCQVNEMIFPAAARVRSFLISVVVTMCVTCDSKPAEVQQQKMAKERKQGACKTFYRSYSKASII